MSRAFAAGVAALALSGCMVGPNYRSPEPNAPSQAPFAGTASPAFTGNEPPGRWWSLFRDPLLDSMVEEALRANTDLRVASANLANARAALRETRAAGLLPTTNISGSVTANQQSGDQLNVAGGGDRLRIYDVGIDVSYQFDLFGQIRRGIEASRANAESVQAAFDVTRITVAAETTQAYADACSAGRQLAVARESVRVQEETYDLVRRQYEGGRVTALELSQAGALLDQTRATIPALEAVRQSSLYALAVLMGRPPTQYPPEAAACDRPPALSEPIPVGDGAGLLARRPDIRAAERSLAAATAQIGVATASLYPSVSIGGSIGTATTQSSQLFTNDSLRFSLGPLISWSFPNIAVARAQIAQAEAQADAALATFDGTWLTALQETESALVTYARALDQLNALRRAHVQGVEALRIARLQYEAGRQDFQVVLNAQQSLVQIDTSVASTEAQVADNLVTVFLALGGGWQDAPPVNRSRE